MSGRSLAPGFVPIPSAKGMEGGKRPRKTPGALPGFKAAMHLRPREDLPVSPGSSGPVVEQDYFSMPATRTPDLTSVANPFDFHNREYSVAQPSTNVPVISKQPPSAPIADVLPWETQPGPMPMTAQFPPRNNFPDVSDSFFKRPKTGKADPNESMNGGTWFIDDRRESMASSSSSQDPFSKSKKSSFSKPGDGLGSRKESDSGTIMPPSGKNKDLPAAPGNSGISPGSALRSRFFSSSAATRPTTPSKEVAPFMYPDTQSPTVKAAPANSSVPKLQMPSSSKHLGKLTIHRSKPSKEDQDESPIQPRSAMFPPRSATNASFLQAPWSAKEPPAQRDPSPSGIRRRPPDPLALRTPPTSAAGFSPFPGSAGDGFQGVGDTTPQTGKRSLFDKIRHPRKDKHKGDTLRNGSMASTTNLVPPTSAQEYNNFDLERVPTRTRDDAPILTLPSPGRDDQPPSDGKSKGGMLPRRLLGNRTRTNASKTSVSSDANVNLWDLDTDLSNMNGILGGPASANSPSGFPSATYPGPTSIPRDFADPNSGLGQAQWQTPESWAYKKVGEQVTDQFKDNVPTQEMPKAKEDGLTYCIRIFRIDSTFATLPAAINTTAAEVLSLLGRKSYIQDDLNNYQLVMKKNDLQRPLLPGERPFLIQRQMLQEAGYTSTDRIWEIGREDHSYIVRFTFVPTRVGGAYNQDRDVGLSKLSKYSNVDLSSKGLGAIPIALYRKVTEIVNLNLSRNLGLDVPSDFLQSCTHLREIKFTGNEVTQVPHSFLLASKLSFLDLTHNNIKELDHIDLATLKNLVVLKMANNRLEELPSYFGKLSSLRTANFASNKLTSIRPNLSGLLNLTEIDLGHNEIETLDALGELVNLEKLWLASNRISRIPETFMNLLKLRHLDLQCNRLSSIGVLGQLSELENLHLGHNSFSSFSGSFTKLRALILNDNPLTKFEIQDHLPSLSTLSLAGGKLAGLDEKFYERLSGLTRLDLDRNQLKSFSNGLGKLTKLQTFSFIGNKVGQLPSTIGYLQELRTLDARECSIRELPAEIWYCSHLTTLNVSSNLLSGFPKLSASAAPLQTLSTVSSTSTLASSIPPTIFEDASPRSNGLTGRRPSQPPSNLLAMGTSPASATRQGSMVSVHGPGGRKVSVIPRGSPIEGNSPISRKDSTMNTRYSGTIADSLRHLFLGDNEITDEVFDVISHLSELRILNLSYNALNEIPQTAFRKWQHLHELYLAGNELSSLPNDDIPELASLKALYLNSNKFQTLPPELAKLPKLVILDVSSNVLKYNVSNWPYDWNWNWNQNLRYLNFSYNRRLEIKPDPNFLGSQRSHADLTNFNALTHLRVLGLMDVTMTIKSVPEENENRRVRTTPSIINSMKYGMSDSLGRQEYLSIFDLAIPSFRSQESETLFAMFDGSALPNRGSRIAKFLQESFGRYLSHEMGLLAPGETPSDALRRTFLALNKDFATFAAESADEKEKHMSASLHKSTLIALTTAEDLEKGSSAAALYFVGSKLYVANVGDVEVALLQGAGTGRLLSRKHVPSDLEESERVRGSGGYINRHDKVNAVADVTRAFGYTHQMPAVHAGPHTTVVNINDSDELVIIASKSFWEYMSLALAFDVARSERDDVMRAAQKLRDLAMSYGAQNKMMVMVVSVANLLKKTRPRHLNNGASPNMSQLGSYEDTAMTTRRRGRRGEAVLDAGLNRLDREVDAPVGELAMVFSDIKGSTALWELNADAMRSSIQIHNELLRRQLRLVGGYEVKTEGDAFMVSFPTATSALLWCFRVQQALLEAEWPQEILESSLGQEILDDDDVVIYRGLSVRMGIHWGDPVCERDPITKRMDYFGPMVNRASRISGIADGGEITCSRDFSNELARLLNTFQESDRSGSTSSAETMMDDVMARAIKRDLSTLSALGFEIKDIGEKKLKGLENPETISLICSQALVGRLVARDRRIEQGQVPSEVPVVSRKRGISLAVDETQIWALYNLVERLESLCATLEFKEPKTIRSASNPLAAKVRELVYEVDNDLACQVLENFVTRAETCISTLTMRFMVRPLVPGRGLMEQAGPMSEIFSELSSQLGELKMLRAAVLEQE